MPFSVVAYGVEIRVVDEEPAVGVALVIFLVLLAIGRLDAGEFGEGFDNYTLPESPVFFHFSLNPRRADSARVLMR